MTDILKLFTTIDLARADEKIQEVSTSVAQALTPYKLKLIEASGIDIFGVHNTCNWAIEMWKNSTTAVNFVLKNSSESHSKAYMDLRNSVSLRIHTDSKIPKKSLSFNDFVDEVYSDFALDLRRVAKEKTYAVPEADDLQMRLARFHYDKKHLTYNELSRVSIERTGLVVHLIP